MNLTAQRGAIPLTLDRTRTLFFGLEGTWLLVERYGINFVTELYSVTEAGADSAELKLKSKDALGFFLWAGLQEELLGTDEKLTMEEAKAFIRPYAIKEIFTSLVLALTGALATPKAPAGKGGAVSAPAKRTAKKTPKKVSTLKVRSGSRLAR